MATIDPEYISELRTALTLFHDGVCPLIAIHAAAPSEQSQATIEQAACTSSEAIVTARGVGMQLIELGADHLSALVKIITEPIEVLAAWTCVRSMLEGCSVSAWLLDPIIDVRTRCARVFALRYEGMKSELKFARLRKSQVEIDKLEPRIDHVEQEAIAAGFSPVLDRNGKRIGIAQQMPKPTELIETVLGEGEMYCMLSAVSHGHSYAIRGLNYVVADGPSESTVSRIPVKMFKKTVNVMGMALLGLTAARALARPLWNQCHFFGWDPNPLEELLERVFDRIGDKPEHRFWRS